MNNVYPQIYTIIDVIYWAGTTLLFGIFIGFLIATVIAEGGKNES